MSDIQEKLQEKMEKTKDVLKNELATVRAGRANAALLDRIVVEYYGTPTPLKNMSNVSVPDPRTLLITPFDPKTIGDIEKAINMANLGINPANDGKVIRLAIPMVTEERRKELTKLVKKMGEEAKIAVRNERRNANEVLKKQEKNAEITEDDLKNDMNEVQKMTDDSIKDIDDIIAEKEKEIMEV